MSPSAPAESRQGQAQPVADIWTKAGFVTMTLEEADAHEAETQATATANRQRSRLRFRKIALRIPAFIATVWAGGLVLFMAHDFLAGTFVGRLADLLLLTSWNGSVIVCGIYTWRTAGRRAEG